MGIFKNLLGNKNSTSEKEKENKNETNELNTVYTKSIRVFLKILI